MSNPVPEMKARNPRTGKCDYRFSPATSAVVAATANDLRRNQPEWQALGLVARADAMCRFADAIQSRRDELISVLVADTGRLSQSMLEVDALAPMIRLNIGFAKTLLADGPPQASFFPGVVARAQLVPFPLVGVVSPWNFPLLLAMIDSIPAFLAGCAVLFKPSEVTPRHSDVLTACFTDVPELRRVAAVVRGAGDIGSAVVDAVDAVCFTGSVRTGRLVAEQAAGRFIPAFLEMGGKDPAIVLASADIDYASTILLRASVAATGQACQSVERIYVARSIHDKFVEMIVTKATHVGLNRADITRGQLGPLIFGAQADTIVDHVADAVQKGAIIRCGGKVVEDGGIWYPATVMTNVTHAMKIMREETFGPIMPIMPFDTVEEAIALANDSHYGLSANVFAGSEAEALAIAHRLNAGVVSINEASLSSMVYEFESEPFGLSGMGRSRTGPEAIRRFFRKKLILTSGSDSPRGIDGRR
ncbi:MAG: aldehyde dehydrogenase family protein [Pseudomonadales bacterium]|nr:aldehyde dehydrogenase family protein [Pseudomonadales bacterium]